MGPPTTKLPSSFHLIKRPCRKRQFLVSCRFHSKHITKCNFKASQIVLWVDFNKLPPESLTKAVNLGRQWVSLAAKINKFCQIFTSWQNFTRNKKPFQACLHFWVSDETTGCYLTRPVLTRVRMWRSGIWGTPIPRKTQFQPANFRAPWTRGVQKIRTKIMLFSLWKFAKHNTLLY